MRLLEMSVSAGVLILFLAVLRRDNIWSLAKRTIMVLWMVVLARLLLPGSLPIRNGIAAPVFRLARRMCSLQKDRANDTGENLIVLVPEAASSGTTGALDAVLLKQAAGWLWLVGMAGVCIYFAYSYRKECRLLAQALPLESLQNPAGYARISASCSTACRLAGIRPQKKTVRIFVHDRIRSPLVFGIIRPRIVIPKSLLHLEQAQMQYILTHEMVHIRRHDNLWKMLSAAAVCIHWFNPAVWLMYVLSARDLELSCDEQVLSFHGSQGRQEYAMTLLTLAQNQKGTTLFCSGFLENPVKERIVAIMKYKKLTGIGVLCAVMLFAGASSVFATNGQPAQLQDADEAARTGDVGAGKDYEVELVSDAEFKAEDADASGTKEKYAGKDAEKEGPAKIIVKGEDEESYYVEFHPDVEIQNGEKITVTFDSPVTIDGNEWNEYSLYVDDDGVSHILNAAGKELESGRTYEVDTQKETNLEYAVDAQDKMNEQLESGIQDNCSSDEDTEPVLVENEVPHAGVGVPK